MRGVSDDEDVSPRVQLGDKYRTVIDLPES